MDGSLIHFAFVYVTDPSDLNYRYGLVIKDLGFPILSVLFLRRERKRKRRKKKGEKGGEM